MGGCHCSLLRAAATVSPEAWIALDGAIVGARALVAAGATVPPGLEIPGGMLAAGVPARVLGPVTGGAGQWVASNPGIYRQLARRHAAGVLPVPGPGAG